MKYSITNLDAKKAFAKFIEDRILPQIYIDEYWDYYINEYNLNDKWDSFVKLFTNEKLTYQSFKKELDNVCINGMGIVKKLWNDKVIQNSKTLLNNTPQKIPYLERNMIPDGEYITVDIHNAVDLAHKYVGAFNEQYTSSNDIISSITPSKIFINKRVKMYLYDIPLSPELLYPIYHKVLIEKLYQSEPKIIKHLNSNFELFCTSGGDNFLYKLPDNRNIDNILGDYINDDISFHIDTITFKHINIFGNKIQIAILKNEKNEVTNIRLYNHIHNYLINAGLYPFAYKLAIGEELNEKDLTIGYEDEIFFHFDKSEIV